MKVKKMKKFSFGSDPEFMIVQNDQLKSAIGILQHKESSEKIYGHKFYYDNVLAEIAIKPGNSSQEVVENTRQCLNILAKKIFPSHFQIKAAAEYPIKELKNNLARIAGCNPEWNVYSLTVIEPPKSVIGFMDGYYYFKSSFRTAGGHIHLGSELLNDPFEIFNVIRMMDLFIGIPSIFIDTDSTSKERRKAYGIAGSHRIPEEGNRLEYRPLGNFWFSSPEHVELIYDLCNFVLQFVENGGHKKFWSINEKLLDEQDPCVAHLCTGYNVNVLQKCINTCDKKQAAKFMLIVENYLPTELIKKIVKLSEKILPDPYKAWRLDV